MANRFNPTGSVQFDLARGRVDLAGEQVLVAADALSALCTAAGDEAIVDFGRRIGTAVGRRVAHRLEEAGERERASIEEVLDQLGGELALSGLGALGLERWGRAMVLTLTGAPFAPDLDLLLASVLEGALQRSFGKDAHAIKLERDDRQVRFLISSRTGATKVRKWIAGGMSFGEALARLQSGKASAT
jgi:hypothetical protein